MTPPSTVWHCLRYADPRAAIAFLTDVVGFTAAIVVGDDDDPSVVHHAQLIWPEGGGVMLGSTSLGSTSAGGEKSATWPQRPGNGGAYVVTADPAAVYARAVAAGATILAELAEADDGRGPAFSLADAEGNFWNFGSYPGE